MTLHRSHRTLLAVLLLLGVGTALLLWPTPSPDAPRAVDGTAPTTTAPTTEMAAAPVELTAAPVFESLDTTVVFPLEVVLELKALDGADETQLRQGARSRLSGMVLDAAGEGRRAEVRFVGGLNQGRVLFCDGLGRFGANDLYPGLALVQLSGGGLPSCLREMCQAKLSDPMARVWPRRASRWMASKRPPMLKAYSLCRRWLRARPSSWLRRSGLPWHAKS
jgi:hypothetical protein